MNKQELEKMRAIRSVKLIELREIYNSYFGAENRIKCLMKMAVDYNEEKCQEILSKYQDEFKYHEIGGRIANFLTLSVEKQIRLFYDITMDYIYGELIEYITKKCFLQDIYQYPSFNAEFSSKEGYHILPDAWAGIKNNCVILKVDGIDALKKRFSSNDEKHRRAYDMLVDLDRQLAPCYKTYEFPDFVSVDYGSGDICFDFSHFEMDIYDPDEDRHALYVVYRYIYE